MAPDLSPCRELFSLDPVLYLDMTEPVRRGTGRVLFVRPDGALVAVEAGDGDSAIYTLCARSEEAALTLQRALGFQCSAGWMYWPEF